MSDRDLDPEEVRMMANFIKLANEAERQLLPLSKGGGNDLDRWVERYVKGHDLVYAIWEARSYCLGHDALLVSGGQELLASEPDWDPSVGAIRVASREAADMLAAHHGDLRDDPSVTCPRLTHIVLRNDGDLIHLLSHGDQNPRPLHRNLTEATRDRAAMNLAERRRRERDEKRRQRHPNG